MLELDGRQVQCNSDCVLLTMGFAIMTFTIKVMRTQTRQKLTCCSHSPYNSKVIFLGRPFVKRFALRYRSVVCLSCLSVCDVHALWPNGWTDQDETWQQGVFLVGQSNEDISDCKGLRVVAMATKFWPK